MATELRFKSSLSVPDFQNYWGWPLEGAVVSEAASGSSKSGSSIFAVMNRISPKKLWLSKWTAVKPIRKDKHFLVSKVIQPELPGEMVQWIEIEAVYSKEVRRIDWRDLRNQEEWRQGWV